MDVAYDRVRCVAVYNSWIFLWMLHMTVAGALLHTAYGVSLWMLHMTVSGALLHTVHGGWPAWNSMSR